MARRISGDKRRGTPNMSYAAVQWDEEHKTDLAGWMDEFGDDLEILIAEMTQQGYRVSFKYDFQDRCAMVTLTQVDHKHVNSDIILIQRAVTSLGAFWKCAYIVLRWYPEKRLPESGDEELWL